MFLHVCVLVSYFFGCKTEFYLPKQSKHLDLSHNFPSKINPKFRFILARSRILGLLWEGKNQLIAEFHKTDLDFGIILESGETAFCSRIIWQFIFTNQVTLLLKL